MKKKHILPFLLLVQIGVLQVLKFFPEIAERFYSNGIYLWISGYARLLFGWIPFSIGDLCYSILIFFIIRWFFRKRKTWKINWKDNLLKIVSFFSVFYFAFHLLWAINYYRIPLYKKMGIEKEYSEKDLVAFTKQLIIKTNAIHFQLAKNPDMKIVFRYSQEQVFKGNLKGYRRLAKIYPYFNYSGRSIKKSLFSWPLTYMGFAGYLNPFTGEAQVNSMVPMYNFPTTVCHEMAHQIGYASESEANFIGFLASVKNENLYYQYSGYSYALKYCLATLEKIEEGKSESFLPLINPGILKDFKESHDFWENHQSFVESGFEIFYDHFLKMNQQKDGMESYSKFVDLMVNYYKKENL